MPVRLAIFDFDGTLTDIGREGPQFLSTYAALLLAVLGADRRAAWAEACRTAIARSPHLGWDMGTGPAAPCDADPYILATTALRLLCEAEGIPVLGDPDEGPGKPNPVRGALGGALYTRSYAAVETRFRPDAALVLGRLLARTDLDVRIVTNSKPDKVRAKLQKLDLPRLPDVTGDAQKFQIALPTRGGYGVEALTPPWTHTSLQRPVDRRRGRYFDTLAHIWDETGIAPAETLVVGDIWELDLALPAALGAHVHLLRRDRMHDYEDAGLAETGGTTGNALSDVLSRFE